MDGTQRLRAATLQQRIASIRRAREAAQKDKATVTIADLRLTVAAQPNNLRGLLYRHQTI